MPLSALANELILLVAENLTNVKDIFSLLRVNRRFAELLTPRFYTVAVHVRLRITDRTQTWVQETVLHWASRKGLTRPIVELIKRGIDITELRSDGSTALYVATQYGREDIVRLLMDQGAASKKLMRIATNDGRTALHAAAEHGRDRIAKFLLECGFNTAAQTESGTTPLHIAVKHGHEAIVEALLAHGANVNIRMASLEGKDESILHWIAQFYCSMVILKSRDLRPIFKLLLEHGAYVMALDTYRRTPLHYAAKNGEGSTSRLLVGNNNNDIPWKLATARAGHREIVALLIKSGADVNARDLGGRTPLHDAAESLDELMVRDLLEAGADSQAVTKYNMTPLKFAQKPSCYSTGDEGVVKILKNHHKGGSINSS